MSPETELKQELRAVREEIARRELLGNPSIDQASLVAPARSQRQYRLKQLSANELETHEKRLRRDIADLDRTGDSLRDWPAAEDEEGET